ncbi:ComEC/Rec2 family competence protein [Clostridium rectalis]|uniref:ComEC/Rec2 family competence protein n=1 Tax=Clostridium rectalis TaxID=2040295 RepID=UPI0013DE227F|nr:MBL fold metallo-hydrolase [Clostridium rectalis]
MKVFKKVICCIVIILLMCTSKVYAKESSEVHFINTRQSDCILIKSKDFNILIDTGAEESADKVLDYLSSNDVDRINYIFITHYHNDHYGGLEKILKYKKVDKVFIPSHPDVMRDIIYRYLYVSGVDVSFIKDEFKIKKNDIKLITIKAKDYDQEIENNNAIVIAGKINGRRYIFASDIEKEREKEIVKEGIIGKCDILKLPHHGLNTSSSNLFLRRVRPLTVIITCNGEESPDEEIIEKLKKMRINIIRTDVDGDIVIK